MPSRGWDFCKGSFRFISTGWVNRTHSAEQRLQKYKSGYETDHQESLHPALDPGVLKPAAIAHPLHMHGWWCWNLFGLAEALICTRIQRSWRPSTTDHPSHMHWLLLCSWWHRLQPGHSGPETTSIRDNLQIMATHTPIDSIRFQGFATFSIPEIEPIFLKISICPPPLVAWSGVVGQPAATAHLCYKSWWQS